VTQLDDDGYDALCVVFKGLLEGTIEPAALLRYVGTANPMAAADRH
jgi:hypothetical protein